MTSPAIKSRNGGFDLAARQTEYLEKLTSRLDQDRFWYILPIDEIDTAKAIGIFDSQTRLILPPPQKINEFLSKHPFAYLCSASSQTILATLQSSSRILWYNDAGIGELSLSEGEERVSEIRAAGLHGWRLPTKDELKEFATTPENPHRQGNEYRLAIEAHTNSFKSSVIKNIFNPTSETGIGAYRWLTTEGCCDIDNNCWNISERDAYIFACHSIWKAADHQTMTADLIMFGWTLMAPSGEIFETAAETRWSNLSSEDLFSALKNEGLKLISADDTNKESAITGALKAVLDKHLIDIDYTPCRLPKLEAAQLSDPEKGLWELWGEDAALLKSHELVARDPGQDVQWRAVAIDFGTSSTVVASETPNGGRELLRIGVRDFYQAVQPQHFENPTVLECLNFPAFHAAWTSGAYRPELDWNWMRAAHEAQASFRDNPGDTQVLASIMPRLKQWALRSERNRIRLNDRQGNEIEVPPLSDRNPVRGQPLPVSSKDPFDPIELYAWYLGMAINWRGRGLFLKYYLSFPVKYERKVKDCILASFRRGLQRSLPQTLIEHHPHLLNDFEVNDLASEPAAYVAAALPHLQIEPTDEGVPYAVFDFGGGTSDFDFGLLRWANDEEDAQGYERVYEHLASSGDNYLGGENLLEHLVFESFRCNLDTLRQARVQFTLPLDAQPFAGSEAFLANTQAAQTNSVMLAAKLRPFLEDEEPNLPTQIKLDLINADGEKKPCELLLDIQALDDILAGRIRKGAEAFLAELARIQPRFPSQAPIHLLLAGNGCRSRYIRDLFDTEGDQWAELIQQAFGEAAPEIIVHPPLPIDETNPHAPTAKTGVALGLLRVAPGKNVLLKNHVHAQHNGQAPFAWFVGRLRRGRLEPGLSPDTTYGEWRELGPLQAGIFYLYATTSPRARSGIPEGDPELNMQRLSFPGADEGSKVFARTSGPNLIELVASREIPTDKAQEAPKRVVLE